MTSDMKLSKALWPKVISRDFEKNEELCNAVLPILFSTTLEGNHHKILQKYNVDWRVTKIC